MREASVRRSLRMPGASGGRDEPDGSRPRIVELDVPHPRIPGIVRQPLDVSDQGGEPVYGRRVHLSRRLETTDPTQSRHGLGCDLTVSDRSAGPRLREARGLPLEDRYRRARGDHQDLFSPARARDLPVEAPATHRPGQVMDRVRRERIWSPPPRWETGRTRRRVRPGRGRTRGWSRRSETRETDGRPGRCDPRHPGGSRVPVDGGRDSRWP